MIINNPIHNALRLYGNQTNPVKKDNQTGATGKQGSLAQARDEVILSSKAQELGQMQKMMSEMPNVRTERVEQLKQQIQSGTYRVSGLDVAQKLVESGVVY